MLFTTVSTEAEVRQMLDLQARNHISTVPTQTIDSQGFLTVKHDPDVLLAMNRAAPSVLAKDGDTVVGYCLAMPQSFRVGVPILEPMFRMLETLSWQGKPLTAWRWFVMGQVCVAETYRGQGVFDGLYAHLRETYRAGFDFVVTEVAERNRRSMRAHERVGFENLHIYTDELTGETWHLIIWNWR